MKREELLENIAPCSLMCYTCEAYEKGIICESAKTLINHLDGLKEFYEKHDPEVAKKYGIAEEVLQRCGAGICSGCRNRQHHGCSIANCFILECTKSHTVDYCGECNEYPCSKTRELFEDEVYQKWLSGNQQIRENGIESYWENNHNKSHYETYKMKSK